MSQSSPAQRVPADSPLILHPIRTRVCSYENFPFSWWSVDPHGADQAAVFVANAILEGAAGVPLALHFDVTGCPSVPRNISRPGRLGGAIEAQLAIFLVVQTQQTVFSLSGNWYDAGAALFSPFFACTEEAARRSLSEACLPPPLP